MHLLLVAQTTVTDSWMVYLNHENLKTLELIVNIELNNLFNWLTANKPTLNIKKSNFVIFRPYQKRLNYLPQVNIFDHEENKNVTLKRWNCIKYLGLLIDENLSWKSHIYTLTTKISKTVDLTAKLRHIVPNRTLLDIYKSLIATYITYGLTSWRTASKTLLNNILVLQKTCTPSHSLCSSKGACNIPFLESKASTARIPILWKKLLI